MEYVQVTLTCLEEYREILIAELAAIGFDSFLETETGIEGYVLQEQFSRDSFDEVISTYRESERGVGKKLRSNRSRQIGVCAGLFSFPSTRFPV